MVGRALAEVDGDLDGFSGIQHAITVEVTEDSSATAEFVEMALMMSASNAPHHVAARPRMRLPTA